MINVTVYKDNANHYMGFCFLGHAGYAESGSDIVCSAVSILVINTINAIEAYTEDAFTLDSEEEIGRIEVRFTEAICHDTQLLLDTMVLGLQEVENMYSDYIHFEIEEV